jgi:predicted outer membrane repeat protein
LSEVYLTVNYTTFTNNLATNGAAIYTVNGGSLKLNGAIFTNNVATNTGGGVFIGEATSSSSISSCSFINNRAQINDGGGLYIGSLTSTTMVRDSVFVGNNPALFGGGIYSYYSSAIITNCTFSGNYASDAGAGLAAQQPTTLTVSNSSFLGNFGGAEGGGGIYCDAVGVTTIDDVDVIGNVVNGCGGGIYISYVLTSFSNPLPFPPLTFPPFPTSPFPFLSFPFPSLFSYLLH